MRVNRIVALFFSPTGGTKKISVEIARNISHSLGVDMISMDFTLPKARQESVIFSKSDLVILATPVVAGRIPNVLLPYLKERIQGNGALGIPVVSFGNRAFDDALIELKTIMEGNGFLSVAGGAFVAQHSFSKILGMGRPDIIDLEEQKEFANKIAEKLKRIDDVNIDDFEVEGHLPFRPYYQPRDIHENPIDIRRVKPKTNEDCINCGVCINNCPLASIDKDNPYNIAGICMKCCACIKKCPVGAKYFDDKGFIYHKQELEKLYIDRVDNKYFV